MLVSLFFLASTSCKFYLYILIKRSDRLKRSDSRFSDSRSDLSSLFAKRERNALAATALLQLCCISAAAVTCSDRRIYLSSLA